jgi:glucosamine--fructose-6-phosphate aminotransferase (isomerizing)
VRRGLRPEAARSPSPEERALFDAPSAAEPLLEALYQDYPLVYITGPDDRDVSLTVSQINTHKIRGATTVVIAEEDPRLRQAAEKRPADNPDYRHVYVRLPETGDTLMAVFSATVALQRLALKMSLKKMAYLDRLAWVDHGAPRRAEEREQVHHGGLRVLHGPVGSSSR